MCAHCGFQVQRSLAPASAVVTGARLGADVSLRITPERVDTILARGVALPASKRETIGSGRDDQDQVTVALVLGTDRTVEPFVTLTVRLEHRRPYRGAPIAQLSIDVATDGSLSIELREEGTTNTASRRGLRLPVMTA
jgi:hypothetical protein